MYVIQLSENPTHHIYLPYALALPSATVPLSASFFASSLFFAAAICHAGIAARPFAIRPYGDDAAGFSAAAAGVDVPAALLPVAEGAGSGAGVAGADTGAGAGVVVPLGVEADPSV